MLSPKDLLSDRQMIRRSGFSKNTADTPSACQQMYLYAHQERAKIYEIKATITETAHVCALWTLYLCLCHLCNPCANPSKLQTDWRVLA